MHIWLSYGNTDRCADERKETDEGYEATFATNTLGTYRLTELLLPLLEKTGTVEAPSRVVVVSSGGLLVCQRVPSDRLT